MNDHSPDLPIDEASVDAPQELSLDEIEAAYLRALEAADDVDSLFPVELLEPAAEETSELATVADHEVQSTASPKLPPTTADHVPGTDSPQPVTSTPTVLDDVTADPVATAAQEPSQAEASKQLAPASGGSQIACEDEPDQRPVTALQVLEALLFVGGDPLPAKRLAETLGGSTTPETVSEYLDQLNACYAQAGRPYEVILGEGGYRLALKPEFESVRRRVYGQGPKEVKLNQEALELLAFIAYQQPVTAAKIEELDKKGSSAIIRQLLRRQLIQLHRNEQTSEDEYRTTKRFLELFGLASIHDLPQAIDFNFK